MRRAISGIKARRCLNQNCNLWFESAHTCICHWVLLEFVLKVTHIFQLLGLKSQIFLPTSIQIPGWIPTKPAKFCQRNKNVKIHQILPNLPQNHPFMAFSCTERFSLKGMCVIIDFPDVHFGTKLSICNTKANWKKMTH